MPWADTDVILIDESHNFRNPAAQRYANLSVFWRQRRPWRDEIARRLPLLMLHLSIMACSICTTNFVSSHAETGDISQHARLDLYRYFLKARQRRERTVQRLLLYRA